MTSHTDIELLTRISEGDDAAFRKLFDRYFTSLSVYASRMLTDTEAAIDVVQSLFVSIYETRATLNVQNVRSFLYQSVKNRCLNEIKHRNIQTRYAANAIITETENSNNVEEAIDLSEMEAMFANALQQLPPQCRKVFEMSRIDGLSNSEIADQLNLSKRTVETQISKALKVMRELIGKE